MDLSKPFEHMPLGIKLSAPPKNHPGFVDSQLQPLSIGDLVAVRKDKCVYIGMIVRFTRTTADVQPVFRPQGKPNYMPPIVKSCKYAYDHPDSDGTLRLRGIVKIEEVI